MIFKFSYYIEIACAFMALLLPSALLSFGDQAVFVTLYYYMRNFCNLIGLEHWLFSFNVKITNLLWVV